MPRRKTTKRTRGRGTTAALEWVGGRFPAPSYVAEGPEPFRPTVLLWAEATGFIVGHGAVHPDEESGALGRLLEEAMRAPQIGDPRRPARIRVADPLLAAEVRAVVGDDVPVTVAPTPEIDMLRASLFDWTLNPPDGVEVDEDEDVSYLESGRISPETMSELFVIADLLALTAPWDVIQDEQPLRIDIPEFEIEGACAVVIGAGGESRGLVIFPSAAGYRAFTAQDPHCLDRGTTWRSLSFLDEDDVPDAMLREVAEYDWPIAGDEWYPMVQHQDPDGVPRPLTERDVAIVTVCALAVGNLVSRRRRTLAAADEPVSEAYTDRNARRVRVTFPYYAYPLFEEVPEGPAAEPKVLPPPGRNDPCHCGSGRKYKKCHLERDRDQAQRETQLHDLHDMDVQLGEAMYDFALQEFGEKRVSLYRGPVPCEHMSLSWAVHHMELDGRTVRDWFREKVKDIPPPELEWLAAQDEAWLSVWEVLDVQPGERGMMLQDQLTGEVRRVFDPEVSLDVVRRDALLARVISFRGSALLSGYRCATLPPVDAADVVRRARKRFPRRGVARPDQLRDHKTTRYLLRSWEKAVENPGWLPVEFDEGDPADWPDTPLPALSGLTPRQAMSTRGGRREVDLLLKETEHRQEQRAPGPHLGFSRIRRELGLDP